MNPIFWARKFALLSLLAVGSAFAADRARDALAEHVRAANDRFKDVSVAVSEDYAPIPCASGIDGGAMGDRRLAATSPSVRRAPCAMVRQ